MQSVGGKLNFNEIVMSSFPFVSFESSRAVPDPDLEVRAGGGGGGRATSRLVVGGGGGGGGGSCHPDL